MPHKVYTMILFTGFVIILHVLDTSARNLPNSVKTDSVRLTIFGNPDDDHPLKTPSQQLISSTFPAPANTLIISNAPASSSVPTPEFTPNVFTKAVLALPILQDFLDVTIDSYEAGDIMHSIELAYLNALGHPSPPVAPNNDAQIITKLNVLTIPLLVHLKGNTVEKFLNFQKIAIVPSHVQSFTKSIENSLKSSVLDDINALIRAIHEGYINFIQSLGLSFSVKAYILSLIFQEEVINLVKVYSHETPNQQLNSTTFPVPANINTISIAPVSSSILLPEFTPNAFTEAVLELPILQNFLDVKIDRFEAGDIIFQIEFAFLTAYGQPSPGTVSNIDGNIIATLNVLTIPLFMHFKGNTVEKFLNFQGIEVVPSHVQSFANSIENSLKSSVLGNNMQLLNAIHKGYTNFIQSLGFRFSEKAYILSLIFQEEVKAYIN